MSGHGAVKEGEPQNSKTAVSGSNGVVQALLTGNVIVILELTRVRLLYHKFVLLYQLNFPSTRASTVNG